MMRVFFLLIVFGLIGCATLTTPEGVDGFIQKYQSDSVKGEEILLETSYKNAFTIVDKILSEYKIFVVKKDFDGKVILCNLDAIKYRLYTPLIIFFVEDGTSTKVVMKGRGRAYCPYLGQRFKDEVKNLKSISNN